MFQTIGKYWVQGYLPYVTMFDHKGPIIFLINAIGYATDGRTGVFMLQVLFLAVDELLAYRMLAKHIPRGISFAAALLLPILLAANWQEGNSTEEYILPLLFASFSLMLDWCDNFALKSYEHNPRAAFIYGLGFAFALLTRVTNALGICVGVAFIVITLVINGKWKNLGLNALYFIVGTALLVVPMCIYFAAHDALYDMWYGTLLFNLDYSAASGTAAPSGIVELLVLFRRYMMGWCLVWSAVFLLIFKKEKRTSAAFWLIIALVNTLFMYTLNDYAHYGIVLLPLCYIAFCILYAESAGVKADSLAKICVWIMTVLVLVSSGLKIYKEKTEVLPPQAYEDWGDDYMPLLEMITEGGKASFVAFDCPRRLYLQSGLRPAFRFFTLQQWMCVNSSAFAETLRSEFAKSDVEYVMTFNLDSEPYATSDIIAEKYTLVANSEHNLYSLYRLNDAE